MVFRFHIIAFSVGFAREKNIAEHAEIDASVSFKSGRGRVAQMCFERFACTSRCTSRHLGQRLFPFFADPTHIAFLVAHLIAYT